MQSKPEEEPEEALDAKGLLEKLQKMKDKLKYKFRFHDPDIPPSLGPPHSIHGLRVTLTQNNAK